MKKYSRFSRIMTLIVAMTVIMFACVDDDFDTPPISEIPIGDVYTIEQIKTLYEDSAEYLNTGTGDAYLFSRDASIYGTVTMDNETDNSYRTFYIQDATGAIAIYQDVSGGAYIGDSVRIYLKDLVVMKYSNLFQLNSNNGGGVNVDDNLIKQGTNNKRTPELATIDQINNDKEYYQGRLIVINDVQFVDTDTSKTYANPDDLETENRLLQDSTDNQILVRTSGYANFAGAAVAKGSGSIIAIVGQYNNDMQLYIRKLSEVEMENVRFDVTPGGGGSGTGTKDDPYNVAEAIVNNTGFKQWVQGYIVGVVEYVDGTGNVFHFDSPFGSVNTNVMIADNANETNSSNVLVVQLPSGVVRTALNLADNAGNHEKQVMVRGNLLDYFGQPGMKETIGCIIDGNEIGETTDVEAILYEDFSSISAPYDPIDIAGWKMVMEAGTIDWHGDGYNGQSAEISAYESGEDNNTAWLITPTVDLSATTAPYLSFYSALKYYAGDLLAVYVSTDYDGGDTPQTATWTELTSANIVDNTDPVDGASGYNYTESGDIDLSAYKAANVYIAFKYVGSGNAGQTTKYRVDNVKIAD